MKKKLLLSFLAVMILTIGIGIGAIASNGLVEIRAFLNNDLKIRMDGKVQQLNDANGHAVLPISYDGATYLPIRAISNLLDVAIDYDSEAYEVILGERLDGIALINEKFSDTLYSKDPAQTTFGGINYEDVLYSPPGSGHNYTALTPDKKYQTLYLQFAPLVNDIEHIEIKDHQKNALLKRVENISVEDGIQTIEVDIAGVETITFNIRKSDREAGWMIPLKASYYK